MLRKEPGPRHHLNHRQLTKSQIAAGRGCRRSSQPMQKRFGLCVKHAGWADKLNDMSQVKPAALLQPQMGRMAWH